jgi:hypothetical protein
MHSASHARFARAATLALICSILACGFALAAPHAILRQLLSKDVNQPPTDEFCRENFGVPCYSPQEMRTAYGMNGLINSGMVGAGQTIIIIDSYGSPTIAADLAAFDAGFGSPSERFPGTRRSTLISPVGPAKRRSTSSGRTPWPPVPPSC